MAIRFYVPVDSIEPSVKKFRGWLAVDAPTHRKGKREERGRGDQVGKSSRLKDIFIYLRKKASRRTAHSRRRRLLRGYFKQNYICFFLSHRATKGRFPCVKNWKKFVISWFSSAMFSHKDAFIYFKTWFENLPLDGLILFTCRQSHTRHSSKSR